LPNPLDLHVVVVTPDMGAPGDSTAPIWPSSSATIPRRPGRLLRAQQHQLYSLDVGGSNQQNSELWPQILESCGVVGSEDVSPGVTDSATDGSAG
jgi:hypothetical protein